MPNHAKFPKCKHTSTCTKLFHSLSDCISIFVSSYRIVWMPRKVKWNKLLPKFIQPVAHITTLCRTLVYVYVVHFNSKIHKIIIIKEKHTERYFGLFSCYCFCCRCVVVLIVVVAFLMIESTARRAYTIHYTSYLGSLT